MKTGNCYVTCEALYHLLGGKNAGWKPLQGKHEGVSHWCLYNNYDACIVDPTWKQFKTVPNYRKFKGKGFLTKKPSKRAKELMKRLLWNEK